MEIKKFIDLGCETAESVEYDHQDARYTYNNLATSEETPFGRNIVFDTDINIDMDRYHPFVMTTDDWAVSLQFKRAIYGSTSTSTFVYAQGPSDTFWHVYVQESSGVYYARIDIYYNDGGLLNMSYAIPDYDETKFYNLTISCVGGAVTMYLDGVSVATDTFTAQPLATQNVLTRIGAGSALNQPEYVLANIIISERGWPEDEAISYATYQVTDYEKDINAYWPLDDIDHVDDHSFKAQNNDIGHGFNPTKVGEFKRYPYFPGVSATSFRVPFAMPYATLAIEFDCIIDADEVQGCLIGRTNTTNIQFWNGSGSTVGVNLGTPDVFIDGVEYPSCTQNELADAICDGTPHHLRFENINGNVQFTSANSCEFYGHQYSTAEANWTRGFIYNIGIDFNNDGSFDHFYPLDEANGLSDTVGGGADLNNRGTTIEWMETSIASLTEGFNERLNAKSLTFSGTEYMTLASSAATSLNGLDGVTLSAWVKNDSGGPILALWNDTEEKWTVSVNSNGTLQTMVTTTDGSGTTTLNSNIKLSDSEWHHIAAVIDLANDECRFYIDGSLDDFSPQTIGRDSSFVSGGSGSSYIASNGTDNFVGSLSELRVYEKALTYSEVQESAAKVINNVPSYNVIFWSVENMSGWTDTGNTYDYSAYATDFQGGSYYNGSNSNNFYISDNQYIHQFTLSDESDISSMSFIQSRDLKALSGDSSISDIHFSPDGAYLFISSYIGFTNSYVRRYSVSTPWDVSSTLTLIDTLTLPYFGFSLTGVYLSTDGTKVFISWQDTNFNREYVREYTLSTPWNLTTATQTGQTGILITYGSMSFNPGGTQFTNRAPSSNNFYLYNLSTPWDIDSISSSSGHNFSGIPSYILSIEFSSDGRYAYLIQKAGSKTVYQYNTILT